MYFWLFSIDSLQYNIGCTFLLISNFNIETKSIEVRSIPLHQTDQRSSVAFQKSCSYNPSNYSTYFDTKSIRKIDKIYICTKNVFLYVQSPPFLCISFCTIPLLPIRNYWQCKTKYSFVTLQGISIPCWKDRILPFFKENIVPNASQNTNAQT